MDQTKVMSQRQAIAIAIVPSPDRQRVLVARRPEHTHQGGLWEFPGGKQRQDETMEECLARELLEECDIRAGGSLPLLRFHYDYPDRELFFDVRVVEQWSGRPRAGEGQELEWRDLNSLDESEFPPPNGRIIRALSLPEIYFITPDLDEYGGEFLDRIGMLLDSGIRMLRLRSRNLTGARRRSIAGELVKLCRAHDCRFIYDGSVREVLELGADGLHLSSNQLLQLQRRPLPRPYLLGASCHNPRELGAAAAVDADFVLLSPVLATASHPERAPLGWTQFAELAADAGIPVYALGGLRPEDLARARRHFARGIAMISGLWTSVA
jgi:8-oxo-dGTP diphosphatase